MKLVMRLGRVAVIAVAAGCGPIPLRQLPPTAHLRISTQLPPRYDGKLAKRFEAAYADVAALLGITGHAPWPGTCDVRCYRSRAAFDEAVLRLGGVRASRESHGYQIDTGSQVVLLIYSTGWFFHGSVFPSFAHEVTHAVLSHYAGHGRLPAWLQEGLAQHFEFEQPEAEPYRRWQQDLAERGDPAERVSIVRAVMAMPRIEVADEASQAFAWRLVEMLLARQAGGFGPFVKALKGGASIDEALREVYGWSVDDLVRRAAM